MDAGDATSSTAAHAAAPDARVLLQNALRALRAGQALFRAEIENAQRSLRALAIGAILAPVLLLGLWFSTLALVLIGLQAAGLGWFAAGALDCVLQVLLLALLLRALRRWTRDLSLPRSRALLLQLSDPDA